MRELFGNIDLSEVLGTDLTVMLIAPEADEVVVVPSLVLLAHAKAPDTLKAVLDIVKQGKISIAGKPLKFLEPQDYNGVTVQPVQLRLNFLLAVAGGYAIVDDYFVLSTTQTGLKSVIDTIIGKTSALSDITFLYRYERCTSVHSAKSTCAGTETLPTAGNCACLSYWTRIGCNYDPAYHRKPVSVRIPRSDFC